MHIFAYYAYGFMHISELLCEKFVSKIRGVAYTEEKVKYERIDSIDVIYLRSTSGTESPACNL